MALHLLVPNNGQLAGGLVPGFKRRKDVAHLFADRIPPQRIPVFRIKSSCFSAHFRNLDPKLVRFHPVLRLDFRNNAIPLPSGNPPGKGRFIRNP